MANLAHVPEGPRLARGYKARLESGSCIPLPCSIAMRVDTQAHSRMISHSEVGEEGCWMDCGSWDFQSRGIFSHLLPETCGGSSRCGRSRVLLQRLLAWQS